MGNNIGILHYGCGNMRSVLNAFQCLDEEPVVITTAKQISAVDRLVLPGVGAFDTAMGSLRKKSFEESLSEHALGKSKPLLGICLGMQLLCGSSAEGDLPGLAFIDASVRSLSSASADLKIPHMGWNSVEFCQDSTLFQGIQNHADFYFVHSYCVIPGDKSLMTGKTVHGAAFTSALQKDNIFGVQFHPEKSQDVGLKILRNFINI